VPATPGTPKGYFHYTVQGTGATLAGIQPAKVGPRTFWVRVPADYDNTRPYRVVYIGQGCGGFNSANTSTYPLFKEAIGGSEQAIYVALDIPTDNANMDCYDNRDGPASQEWEAFELFHSVVDANYCVDNNHIYVAGYSTGGWLANMWGCYFAGDGQNPASTPGVPRRFAPKYHIRGQAASSGGEPPNNPPCNGKVAAIWVHDANDIGNPIAGSIAALTRVGMMNGCDTTYANAAIQAPWHTDNPLLGDTCKRFTTCSGANPVIFCTTVGLGHSDGSGRAIPAFTQFFDEVEAADAAGPTACTSTTANSPAISPHAFCTNLLATCSGLDGLSLPAAYSSEAGCEAAYAARTKSQQQCQSYHLCGNAFGMSVTDRRTHCPHAFGAGPCQ
jgi:poly(3-hydroxybutyrate) depolymerase